MINALRNNVSVAAMGGALLFLAALSGCDGTATKEPEKVKIVRPGTIIGSWKNNNMRVMMRTYNNTDRDSLLVVTSDTWGSIMKIRPIITFFRENGTYHSEHHKLTGEEFYDPWGRWQIRGDTIVMTDTFPGQTVYKLQYELGDDTVYFRGVEDFDGDGDADDEYYGFQTRME